MAEIVETKTDEATGREYYVYSDESQKWLSDGRFKKPPPAHTITPERGRALAQIAKDNAFLDKARAFARKQGVDVDNATQEEILQGYSQAREAIHGKALDVYMDAKTSRGAEGLYTQLIKVGDERDEHREGNTINVVVPMPEHVARFIADLHRLAMQNREAQANQFVDVIEGRTEG